MQKSRLVLRRLFFADSVLPFVEGAFPLPEAEKVAALCITLDGVEPEGGAAGCGAAEESSAIVGGEAGLVILDVGDAVHFDFLHLRTVDGTNLAAMEQYDSNQQNCCDAKTEGNFLFHRITFLTSHGMTCDRNRPATKDTVLAQAAERMNLRNSAASQVIAAAMTRSRTVMVTLSSAEAPSGVMCFSTTTV